MRGTQGGHCPHLSSPLSAGAGMFLISRNTPHWRKVSWLHSGSGGKSWRLLERAEYIRHPWEEVRRFAFDQSSHKYLVFGQFGPLNSPLAPPLDPIWGHLSSALSQLPLSAPGCPRRHRQSGTPSLGLVPSIPMCPFVLLYSLFIQLQMFIPQSNNFHE